MRLPHVLTGLLALAAFVAGPGDALAKPNRAARSRPSPARSASAGLFEGKESGSLRVWKVSEDPAAAPPLVRVVSASGVTLESAAYPLAPGGYSFGGYARVPAKPLVVEIAAAEDGQFKEPARLPLFFKGESAATLLVRQTAGAAFTVELIADPAPAAGDLTIYNFLPSNAGEVQITLGDALTARLAAGSGSVRLRGLPRQTYVSSINARVSEGRSVHWNSEVDLKSSRQASLAVYLDGYGRIRTKLISEDAAAPAPNP